MSRVKESCRSWRQLVLPVYLLFLSPPLDSAGTVAEGVKLQGHLLVDHPVNRRGCIHGIGKDAPPL